MRPSIVSQKYIIKVEWDNYIKLESLKIENSKHQITNIKQYPNSKFKKIPLTPFSKVGKQALACYRVLLRPELRQNEAYQLQSV